MKNPVTLLNVTSLTNFRKDGHPSIFGKNVTAGIKVSSRRQDCSHWCLPGVPDAWNELIYATLFQHWLSKSWNNNLPSSFSTGKEKIFIILLSPGMENSKFCIVQDLQCELWLCKSWNFFFLQPFLNLWYIYIHVGEMCSDDWWGYYFWSYLFNAGGCFWVASVVGLFPRRLHKVMPWLKAVSNHQTPLLGLDHKTWVYRIILN